MLVEGFPSAPIQGFVDVAAVKMKPSSVLLRKVLKNSRKLTVRWGGRRSRFLGLYRGTPSWKEKWV